MLGIDAPSSHSVEIYRRYEEAPLTSTQTLALKVAQARGENITAADIRAQWTKDHPGADEVGIVASALLNDGRYAVLADRSTSGSPAQWGDAVVRCHDDLDADDVVVEVNFGGDMATEVIKQAAERAHQQGRRETNLIRIKEVSASRGKAMRAEPLYEKGRVLHRRGPDQSESEMMAFSREWDRAVDGSPNRLDAMVWGLTRLSKVAGANAPIGHRHAPGSTTRAHEHAEDPCRPRQCREHHGQRARPR